MSDPVNEEYVAMRGAESTRAMEWMRLYSKNPELAGTLSQLFYLPDEDARFIMRLLNSTYDALFFYKLSIKQPKKKPTKKTILATM